MKPLNRLIWLTLALHFFILIAAGHGVAFLGLIEFFALAEILRGNIEFNVAPAFDLPLFIAAMLALTGQTGLLISYFKKRKWLLVYFSVCLLVSSFFLLAFSENISFWSGIPFLISAALLLVRIINIQRLMRTNSGA